jgi:NitT/TauT family transport system substrate-binding protein
MCTNKRNWFRVGWLLSLILAVLVPVTASAQEEVVKLGDLAVLSNAGIYIAIEKGFFKEQGIRNDISSFASAAKMVPALTAGELDVSVGSPSAGLFNAIAQGAGYRIVADKGQVRPGYSFTLLTVRKDLVDSGQVKSVGDLKGRKVATLAKGIIQDYVLGRMAEEVGLTIKDFDITYLAGPTQVTAYETKAIDAAFAVEPWPARFEERGLAVRFRKPEQVKGLIPLQVAAIMYSGKFIQERRPVAQRWMNAYLKGCKVYASKGIQDPEILAIMEKYTKVPATVIKASIPYYQEPDGKLILESLADMIAWFHANGYTKEKISVDKVVDLSFLK